MTLPLRTAWPFVLLCLGGCFKAPSPPLASNIAAKAKEETGSNAKFPKMKPGSKALLIGCTKYINLGPSTMLHGPANDVLLMKKLLTTQFDFLDSNIIVLSESAGDDRHPKKANIQNAFDHIATQCDKGEHFVFFFAGHGTQVPDQQPASDQDPEPDGFDEVLLPSDTDRWDADSKSLPNAILDDELRVWLQKIVTRGAIPWVIVDACHSGTVVRAEVTETYRKIHSEDMGIPESVLTQAAAMATSRDAWRETIAFEVPEQVPELAALYAALPSEPTPEMAPPDGNDKRVYGLLTYTLYKTLTTATSALSYEDLATRIRSQYRAWGRMHPTPVAEGKRLNDKVLSSDKLARSSPIHLQRDGQKLKVNAGSLFGYHVGTVLAVYPLPGEPNPEKPLGAVRIANEGFDPFESDVEPFAFTELNLPELPATVADGCPCKPVYVDYGEQSLRIAVATQDSQLDLLNDSDRKEDEALRRRVSELLRIIANDRSSLIEFTSPTTAQWVLRVHGGQVELETAQGWVREFADQAAPPRFGPVPASDEMQEWLKERFRRITQAANLLRLAAVTVDSDVRVKLRMLHFKDPSDREGEVVTEQSSLVLRDGDIIAFQAENEGSSAIDLTLLFLDSGYGIKALFPRASVLDNRLSPGKKVTTSRFPVNTKTTGVEHVLAIAVQAKDIPVAFSFLEQATIEQVNRQSGERGVSNPLGSLLKRAQYREGTTRGLTIDEFKSYAVSSLSWSVAKPVK